MSTFLSSLIASSSEETRGDFVEMAREGESLLAAMGGTRPSPSAVSFSPATTRADWDAWTDRYADNADVVHAMPLSVLFAGISGWDVRSDPVVQALTTATPPTWAQLRNTASGRVLPAGVAPLFDWFASRDEPMERGNDLQQFASRAHRAWWAEALGRYAVSARPSPVNPGRPPVVPGAPGRGGGGGAVLLALLAAWAYSRRRKRG